MPIVKYRKKPVVIETVVWDGTNLAEMLEFTGGKFRRWSGRGRITGEVYDALHDTWIGVKTSDLIIKGLAGEFYPHDADTMPKAYDRVGS